ncbi:putative NAD(P)-binding protein [Amycolatopsis sulphurea]|uniref:Putative NAD(P)-binding protein n=1 Tax=Amycolatopsis sulphurea TaxID=76022 RepID=A0A2A9F5L9_9PSEU|nr:putative NAD(P)-binding protein [Amycolatopsis sulphurea]
MDYDAVIVGSGHNGLVVAAYLAGAGRPVLVLERRDGIGGAPVSSRPFAGVDVRLSRYSYLVSLLPRRIIADLGLDERHRMSSYVPVDGTGLLVDIATEARTAESFRTVTGSTKDFEAWQRFYALAGRVAAVTFDAFGGTFHVNESFSQLETACAEAAAGRIPALPPCEIYSQSLTDGSILGAAERESGVQTLTLFGFHMPARLFEADNERAPRSTASYLGFAEQRAGRVDRGLPCAGRGWQPVRGSEDTAAAG